MKLSSIRTWTLFLVTVLMMCAGANAAGDRQLQGFQIVNRISTPGEGSWGRPSFDSVSRRLYVGRGDRIAVLNVDSRSVVGFVSGVSDVRDVVVIPELERGFAASGAGNTVTIFNLKTLSAISTVKTGKAPDRIVYDQRTQRVFVLNTGERSVTVLRANDGALVGSLPLVDDPSGAVADGLGHLYVNLEDPAEIAVIDTTTLKLMHRILLAPCHEPRGLTIDREHRRLFSSCSNGMLVVVNPDSRKVVARLPVGHRGGDVEFDAERQLLYAADDAGTLTVVRENSPHSFSVVDKVRTSRGASSMALDPIAHELFVATAEFEHSVVQDRNRIVPGSLAVWVLAAPEMTAEASQPK